MTPDNRLLLSKYFYKRGSSILREGGSFDAGLAVSLFQDAAEIALLACAASISASPKDRAGFESLWDDTSKALAAAGKESLRMKIDMIALNKARVNFKHVGQVPDPRVAESCRINCGEFLAWVTKEYFGRDFLSLSLVSFVSDKNEQKSLEAASSSLEAGDVKRALLRCSEALSHLSERRQKFYRHGILVQSGGLDRKIADYVNNEVVQLRKQIWDLEAIVFAQVCGTSATDFLVVRDILPHQRGTEVTFPFPTESLSVDTVGRCIEFLAQFSIGLSQRLQSPHEFLGENAWLL